MCSRPAGSYRTVARRPAILAQHTFCRSKTCRTLCSKPLAVACSRANDLCDVDNRECMLIGSAGGICDSEVGVVGKKLSTSMEIATETGSCGFKASCTQFIASSPYPHPTRAGHGAAFSDDERLVLRFLEPISNCKYSLLCPHNDALCGEFFTAGYASTQDAADVGPCVHGMCAGKLCVAAWRQAGIGIVRP